MRGGPDVFSTAHLHREVLVVKRWHTTCLLLVLGAQGCASNEDTAAVETDAAALPDAGGGAQDAGMAFDSGVPLEDALGSPDAPPGADAAAPPCAVLVRGVSVPALSDVAAGPGAFVHIRGQITGRPPDLVPVWTWAVRTLAGEPVAAETPAGQDPSLVRIPVERPGTYAVDVMVSPTCTGMATFTAVERSQRRSPFYLRVLPQRESQLPPQNFPQIIEAGTPAYTQLTVLTGFKAGISAYHAEGPLGRQQVPAFMRVSSVTSSFTREGETTTGTLAFTPTLSPGAYDVLVMPTALDRAPRLVRGLSAPQLARLEVEVSTGVNVRGLVTQGGVPLGGVRVMLRQDALPSTLGVSAANGQFSLWARPGVHSLRVVGPRDVPLPVLDLPLDAGVTVPPETQAGPLPISLIYEDPARATLTLVLTQPGGGGPEAGAEVRLQSLDLGTVATLSVAGGPAQPLSGKVELSLVTDAGGQVRVPDLPRGRYRAILRPAAHAGATAAQRTVLELDLTSGDLEHTVAVAAAVEVTGQLRADESPEGLSVVALLEESAEPAASALVAADGSFRMRLSPETNYRLRVDAPLGRLVPRVVFGSIRTEAGPQTLPPLSLPRSLRLSGKVLEANGKGLSGAVVQAFCAATTTDSLSYCVDFSQPAVGGALPIAEAVAGPDGSFVLVLPDPFSG